MAEHEHVWGPQTGEGRLHALAIAHGWYPLVCVECGRPQEGPPMDSHVLDRAEAIRRAIAGNHRGHATWPIDECAEPECITLRGLLQPPQPPEEPEDAYGDPREYTAHP